jgi:hypothetical protein
MAHRNVPVISGTENNQSSLHQPLAPTPEIAVNGYEAEIKAFGVSVRVPLPKWAVALIAAVLVLGLITLGGYLSYAHLASQAILPRNTLNEYEEGYKHSLEANDLREDQLISFPDGTNVTLRHFKSDGCFQIVRNIPAISKSDGLWMFGPNLTPDKQSQIRSNTLASHATLEASSVGSKVPQLLATASHKRKMAGAKLMQAQYNQPPENYKEVQLRRCLDPHPGEFSEKRQRTAQCEVQVWRYFADGCIHFQLFNPCSGTWDVNPNGSPHVTWQKCVH